MAKRRKKKKTVLVTGASGFLGYHVVQELLCLDVNVRTLSRRAEPRLADLGVEQYQGSVTDQSTCMDALDGIDQVIILPELSLAVLPIAAFSRCARNRHTEYSRRVSRPKDQ